MTTSGMTPEQAARLSLAEQHEWYKHATSRRTMLRGGLVGAAVITAPALSIGSASASTGSAAPAASPSNSASLLQKADRPTGSTVAPFGRHIAYGAAPTSQISVAWQVPALVSNPFIRIGRSPGDLGHKIDAELKTLSTLASDTKPLDSVPLVSPTTIEQYYLHAAVKNLQPGETYYYTVGHDGWDPTADLAVVNSFTTAAAGRGPFTFTAFGDQGVTYDAARSTQQINGLRPAFHLHAGDVSYAEDTGHGLIADSYDPRVWDSFFTQVESVAATTPWQIAVGNHEMEAWYSPDGYGGQHSRFDFPSSQTTYYSFTYGNVAVLSLDANDVSYEIPANLGYSGGAQTAWLAKELAAFRARKDIDFIVAYFHHCAYSTCTSHGSEGGVRQYWGPLFDKYSVDLVINGHNHIYERNDPLKNGVATTAAPIGSTIKPATEGTTYLVAGGAGDSLYAFSAADSYEGSVDNVASISGYVNETGGTTVTQNVTWSRVRYTGYALLVVDSKPSWNEGGKSTLTVRAVDSFGAEIDNITLER
jgi:Purple acid Phosphatase, N-terminal domain/Calcineurin-like phosphoesterase